MPRCSIMLMLLIAAAPRAEAKRGELLMPDLAKVLGAAYEVPPELTSRAKPGDILRISENKMAVWKSGCLAAEHTEVDITSIKMQSSLAGGVRLAIAGTGARGEAATSIALSFSSPFVLTFDESEIRNLTPACDRAVRAEGKRSGLHGLVLVEETLLAKINGCKKVTAKAGWTLFGREASIEAGSSCQMFSDKPVVVGFRTRPVLEVISRERPGLEVDLLSADGIESTLLTERPTGQVTTSTGIDSHDYAALAMNLAAVEQLKLKREAAIEAAETIEAERIAKARTQIRAKEAEIAGRAQAERAVLQARDTAARSALEAERSLRVQAAVTQIRIRANQDLDALRPLMTGRPSSSARTILLKFLKQYGGAEVTIDEEVIQVDLSAVRTVRAYLGQGLSLTPANSIGLIFVELAPGRFTMGCTPSQQGDCESDEHAHPVQLSHMVAVATTEVTQAQWEAVMGEQPSAAGSCGEQCPVENISWLDAADFANRLSALEGLAGCYTIEQQQVSWPSGLDCLGYRLLTEAEWEFAARGGQDHRFSGSGVSSEVAWTGSNSSGQVRPVATRKPNAWNIYDMSGSVWEWVWDAHAPFTESAQTGPTGPHQGSARVLRGGSWYLPDEEARVSRRFSYYPGYQSHDLGLRIGRTIE